MLDLKGKVALVTGAASGIGFAYVKELLRNKLKAVALVDIDPVNGQRALDDVIQEFGKGSAIFVKADVSDKTQLEEAFETTVQAFKQLDILINNAGIFNERQWEKTISINFMAVVTGSMLAIEKYFPKYKSGSEAVIVNTASIAGLQPLDGCPAYCSAKFGVVGFSGSMGTLQFQKTKTRVLVICPSYTDTSMAELNEEKLEEPFFSLYLGMSTMQPHQKPEDLCKSVMGVIKDAPSGSAWMVADGICTQLEFPKYLG